MSETYMNIFWCNGLVEISKSPIVNSRKKCGLDCALDHQTLELAELQPIHAELQKIGATLKSINQKLDSLTRYQHERI